MKISISKSGNKPIIVVDIQPAYDAYMRYEVVVETIKIFNESRGKILYFFNGPYYTETGEREDDVKEYLIDNGLNVSVFDRITFYEKDYGFFRNWLDVGIPDKNIIRAIREMFRLHIKDSRDIDWKKFFGSEYKKSMNYMMYIPVLSVSTLKQYNNCLLLGGGINTCLREIRLLLNAFNIKYTLYEKGIY